MTQKRSKTTGLLPCPKAGIWPPPVYEARYLHSSDCGDGLPVFVSERVVRMSFWSPAKKPVDAARRREIMSEPYYAKGAQFVAGYVCQGKARRQDYPAVEVQPVEAKRVTAKQVREGLGRLLACLDGSITNHDEVRRVVVECRRLAA